MFSRHRWGAFFLIVSQHYYHMHDQHKFSAQAFASMAFELHRHTRPLDGEDDEDLQERPADGASVLSSCSSYGSMPALVDVHTGEVHVEPECKGNECSDGVWEDIARGDGDTTRGDGDAEDTGELTLRVYDGQFGVNTAHWGGHWGDDYLENLMNEDLKKSVCQVIVIQEADITHGGGATMVAQKSTRTIMRPCESDSLNWCWTTSMRQRQMHCLCSLRERSNAY